MGFFLSLSLSFIHNLFGLVVVYETTATIKYPDKNQRKREWAFMAHNFRLQFITVGNLRWRELGAAHHATLSLEQRTVNECMSVSAHSLTPLLNNSESSS